MTSSSITFSVFTKPWKTPLAELGRMVSALGFDGIELPVRPGYQVEPERVAHDLPVAVRTLGEFGVRITSVASTPSEPLIAACAEYGIPLIRTMAQIGAEGYLASVAALQREYAQVLPLLERYNVTLGVQNHYGNYVCNAMGLRHLLEPFDSPNIGAVWDPSHTALCGEEPEFAIEIVWPFLRMVNLKNVFWRRRTGPEAEDVDWKPYWTSGRQGLASWPRVITELRRRNYSGVVCLTAEYSDEPAVERLIATDIAYARQLFAEAV
jgi:sugar phosphate isomerase/epimerase